MNIPMTASEKREMWAELLDIVGRKSRDEFPQPNITSAELSELEGISHPEAYSRLEAAVQRGELEKAKNIYVDGTTRNLYWKTQNSATRS